MTQKKRLLITGGSGFLGKHLVPLACDAYEVVYTWFSAEPTLPSFKDIHAAQLDLREGAAVQQLITDFQPHAIIHTAGSNRSADMHGTIVNGTTNLINACGDGAVRFVHLSSDVIFDGTQAPYAESAELNPIHEYGRCKAEAEAIVGRYVNHAIVRTSLIYSLNIIDMGTKWMKESLEQGKQITLFTNQMRNPVLADELATACLCLVEKEFVGVMNVVGDQEISRADFGRKMLQHWAIPQTELVQFAPDNSGRWPIDTTMPNDLAKQVLGIELRGVDAVFRN